jgi:hypothetical protein
MAERPRRPRGAESAHAELPDVRDGLTRLERVVLSVLSACQKEFPGRGVPTAVLYGRVVEQVNVSVDELQKVLVKLGARR